MFKLLHNCIHFTCQQCHAQNPSSQASTGCKPRTSRCTSWIQKRQRNQASNCQHPLDHRKKQKNFREKESFSASLTMLKPLTVWITTNWKILQELLIPDHLTCLLRNLCLLMQSCPTLCNPMGCSPPGSSAHGDSPSKNTRVSCQALLQGIIPTQGSNLGLLHCRQIHMQVKKQQLELDRK